MTARPADATDATDPTDATARNDAYVVPLGELTSRDVGRAGGKNASLGELIRALHPAGIRVPPGFATTAQAYWHFLDTNHLREPIEEVVHLD